MREIKVSLNELLSIAGYYVEKTTLPPYKELEQRFHPTWKDIYLDESLSDNEGQDVFMIIDRYSDRIRAVVVRPTFDTTTKVLLIDLMDNVIYDLMYNDIISIIDKDIDKFDGSYESLLQYIIKHKKKLINKISDFEYSFLLVLAEYRLDLLEL